MSAPLTPDALASIASRLMAAKMFSLASCVMLFYDILITFGDEVENIWKKKYTFATVLWTMNRYLNPLGYIIVIVSFNDPSWGVTACERYVLFPEVLKLFTASAIGVIFIFRLYSLYGGSFFVLGSISALLVAQLAVKIWAFTDGTRLVLPPGLVGCILTGKDTSNDRFVFTWVAELVFDSAVFIATLSRTLVIYRRHRHGAAIPLIRVMMRDGIIYFLVIFAANIVTVTLFIVLPPDLKAINASFSTLITSLMVSRLILNLRTQASRPRRPRTGDFTSFFSAYPTSYPSTNAPPSTLQDPSPTDRQHLVSTIIGNLGEPVEFDWFDEPEGFDVRGTGTEPGSSRGHGSEGGTFDADIDDDDAKLDAEPGTEHYELAVTRSPIIVEVTVTRAESAVSRADGALPRFSLSGDVRSVGSASASAISESTLVSPTGHTHSILSVLPPPQSPLPLRATRESNARGLRVRPGTSTDAGRGAWRPPDAWNLEEGVDITELGRPRKSQRRPRTS